MKPTDEQIAACDQFETGDHTRVIAFAGAGKTSTLTNMARNTSRRGVYIAFNRAIAQEAQRKFPNNVQCMTAHSLAGRSIAAQGFDRDKMYTKINGRTIGDTQHVDASLANYTTARQLIIGTLRRFCQSSDDSIQWFHCPRPAIPMHRDDMLELRYSVAGATATKWNEMIDRNSRAPLGFDGYLKLWALQKPRLDYDFVMVDEAQDLNPVLIGILEDNVNRQIVSVGDRHQQIYAWRGAVDALEQLPGKTCVLTQSFRFGENIAAYADQVLRAMGEEHELRGNGRTDDYAGEDDCLADAILCRTNSAVINTLLELLELNNKVHVSGGTAELSALVSDAKRLQAGQPAITGDLLGFTDWQQVEEVAEQETNLQVFVRLVNRYGVDTLSDVLGRTLPVATPDSITVSTAHKAKGLEWDCVEIDAGFEVSGADDIGAEERRLFYVAVTRAQNSVIVTSRMNAYLRA